MCAPPQMQPCERKIKVMNIITNMYVMKYASSGVSPPSPLSPFSLSVCSVSSPLGSFSMRSQTFIATAHSMAKKGQSDYNVILAASRQTHALTHVRSQVWRRTTHRREETESIGDRAECTRHHIKPLIENAVGSTSAPRKAAAIDHYQKCTNDAKKGEDEMVRSDLR